MALDKEPIPEHAQERPSTWLDRLTLTTAEQRGVMALEAPLVILTAFVLVGVCCLILAVVLSIIQFVISVFFHGPLVLHWLYFAAGILLWIVGFLICGVNLYIVLKYKEVWRRPAEARSENLPSLLPGFLGAFSLIFGAFFFAAALAAMMKTFPVISTSYPVDVATFNSCVYYVSRNIWGLVLLDVSATAYIFCAALGLVEWFLRFPGRALNFIGKRFRPKANEPTSPPEANE